ncbi:MAG: type II toxin-antitoxin system RelE/ParE family toxin [Novosphingobium sp.]
MTRRLSIAPAARADIISIWDYTAAKHGIGAADAYVTDLDTVMLRLLDYPMLGEDCSSIRRGYRRIRARDHVIYYVPHDGGIEVMRLLHPRQDSVRQLRI